MVALYDLVPNILEEFIASGLLSFSVCFAIYRRPVKPMTRVGMNIHDCKTKSGHDRENYTEKLRRNLEVRYPFQETLSAQWTGREARRHPVLGLHGSRG
jgi:hypothetical protein